MPSLQDILTAMATGSGYPTPDEIMVDPPTHKAEVIAAVKDWKRTIWKEKKSLAEMERFQALKELITRLAVLYNKPVDVVYQAEMPSACYQPMFTRIVLNQNLSIITALHELAHHLFGTSEKKACRWSVHLFKKAFPKAFTKLEWRGHCLVKRDLSAQIAQAAGATT